MSVDRCTNLMRDSQDPLWKRLRECFGERGLASMSTILVTYWPEDSRFLSGILVAADGEVYEFGFDYLNLDVGSGLIAEWQNISAVWRDGIFRGEVAEAFEVLAAEVGQRDT